MMTAQDVTAGFCIERHVEADALVIAFSSLGVDDAATPHEFMGLLERDDCSVLLLRDVAGSWFHAVPGLSGGVEGVARFLAERCRDADRLVCLGYSMGGYAALLFGRLLGASEILALAPQTLIDPNRLQAIGDRRWIGHLSSVSAQPGSAAWLDLAPMFQSSLLSLPGQRTTVFLGADTRSMDDLHADRLGSAVEIARLTSTLLAHGAVMGALRESGLLREIVGDALRADPKPYDLDRSYRRWIAGRDHSFEVDPAEISFTPDGDLHVRGRLRNDGTHTLRFGEGEPCPVRLGSRVWPERGRGDPLLDVRGVLTTAELAPGDACVFEITLPVSGLPPRSYQASIALVREGRAWFDDLGFASFPLTLDAETTS